MFTLFFVQIILIAVLVVSQHLLKKVLDQLEIILPVNFLTIG